MLRYSLVFFFIAFGPYKFTAEEAQGIQPLMANSPLFSWLYLIFDVSGASNFVGVIEVTAGVLIAARRWAPRLSAIGSLMAAFALICTLSFLITTPGVSPDMQGFLMKDLALLGAALWTAGEALLAASFRDADGRLGDEDAALTTGRADADHICRLRNEAACPESECPVEQQAIHIERVR